MIFGVCQNQSHHKFMTTKMNSLDRIAKYSGFDSWELLIKKVKKLKNGIKIQIPLYFRLQLSDNLFNQIKNNIDNLSIEVYDTHILIKK